MKPTLLKLPELGHYDPDWVPLLEAAKELVRSMDVKYVCNALYAAAQSSNAGEKFSAQAEEMISIIESALGDHDTVIGWFNENHSDTVLDVTNYRLAWIDHMIEECQK